MTDSKSDPINYSTEIVLRLKDVLGFRFDRQFADLMEISPSNLANQKQRDTLDKERLLAREPRLNRDWLFGNNIDDIRHGDPFRPPGSAPAGPPPSKSDADAALARFVNAANNPLKPLLARYTEVKDMVDLLDTTYADHPEVLYAKQREVLKAFQKFVNDHVAFIEHNDH